MFYSKNVFFVYVFGAHTSALFELVRFRPIPLSHVIHSDMDIERHVLEGHFFVVVHFLSDLFHPIRLNHFGCVDIAPVLVYPIDNTLSLNALTYLARYVIVRDTLFYLQPHDRTQGISIESNIQKELFFDCHIDCKS